MRLILNLATGTLVTVGLLTAAPPPCVPGTFASYIALGANGCTFGQTVFANFSYSGTAKAGASIIRADQITVTPLLIVPATTTFTFSAAWNVASGQQQDSMIEYTAALPCDDTATVELDLTLGPAQVGGIIGKVLVRESTNVGVLNVFDNCTEVCQSQATDMRQFQPVRVLLIGNHVSLVGGTGGASLKEFGSALNRCIPCV
jgi:hypothetical protein